MVLGTSGEAYGYVTLMISEKLRTLLKLIPLPKKMSQTPDQAEEFNVYSYLKQLIDGNDVGVLLRVADEVVSVMDVLHFYVPTIDQVAAAALYSVDSDYFAAVREEYKRRRDTVMRKLNEIPGVVCECPKGAFYLMAALPVDDAEKFQQAPLNFFPTGDKCLPRLAQTTLTSMMPM